MSGRSSQATGCYLAVYVLSDSKAKKPVDSVGGADRALLGRLGRAASRSRPVGLMCGASRRLCARDSSALTPKQLPRLRERPELRQGGQAIRLRLRATAALTALLRGRDHAARMTPEQAFWRRVSRSRRLQALVVLTRKRRVFQYAKGIARQSGKRYFGVVRPVPPLDLPNHTVLLFSKRAAILRSQLGVKSLALGLGVRKPKANSRQPVTALCKIKLTLNLNLPEVYGAVKATTSSGEGGAIVEVETALPSEAAMTSAGLMPHLVYCQSARA